MRRNLPRRLALAALVSLFELWAQIGLPQPPSSQTAWHAWGGLPAQYASGFTGSGDYRGDQILLFFGAESIVYSPRSGQSQPSMRWPLEPRGAVAWDADTLAVFGRTSFVWYSLSRQQAVSSPESLAAWKLPPSWDRIDAAARWGDTKILFFKGNEFLVLDRSSAAVDAPKPLAGIPGWPKTWTEGVDCAVDGGDGRLYLFRGHKYAAVDIVTGAVITPEPLALGAANGASATAAGLPTPPSAAVVPVQAPAPPAAEAVRAAPTVRGAAPYPLFEPVQQPKTEKAANVAFERTGRGNGASATPNDALTFFIGAPDSPSKGIYATFGGMYGIDVLMREVPGMAAFGQPFVESLAGWSAAIAASGARSGDRWTVHGPGGAGQSIHFTLVGINRQIPGTDSWARVN